MLIGATIAGREKVEVNPTTKLSRAIQGDKGSSSLKQITHRATSSHKWRPAFRLV